MKSKGNAGYEEDATAHEAASLFEGAGWVVNRDTPADFIARKGALTYAAEIKRASEPRIDRVVPLVSQAILQARRRAENVPGAVPLVIVIGSSIPLRVVNSVKNFVHEHAADVSLGFMDAQGMREFVGAGLETLNTPRSTTSSAVTAKPVDLFSDLNQWLLKVLLAADLADERLLNAQVKRYRNATELAHGAGVSVMTSFRFIEQLRSKGHLHESSPHLRLVRLDELLERWRVASGSPSVVVEATWLFAGDKRSEIRRASESLDDDICVGSHAAADALGFGIARGVPTLFYLRNLPDDFGRTLGLVRASGSEANVTLALPKAKESVFRGAVHLNGIRSSDVLQAWLDVSHDPSRGREQADHLKRKVIEPMLKRSSR